MHCDRERRHLKIPCRSAVSEDVCADHIFRLNDECLVVGDWSRIHVRPCSVHLEEADEQVEELLRLHGAAAGQAAGVALPGDVTYPVPCPVGVRVSKVVLDPPLEGCLSIPDALLQVFPCVAVGCCVTRLENSVVILKYGPVYATETVLQLLRSPLWPHLYGSSSWFNVCFRS